VMGFAALNPSYDRYGNARVNRICCRGRSGLVSFTWTEI